MQIGRGACNSVGMWMRGQGAISNSLVLKDSLGGSRFGSYVIRKARGERTCFET